MAHGNYGYVGKILRVNLGEEAFDTEPLRKDFAEKYVGGRGLAARILWEEVEPSIDPLSPSNKLIFMTGPLNGTRAPSASKFCVVTKSYLTGIFAVSLCSGYFGSDLKFAGFDGIIIGGKSERPVYLWIDDGNIQVKDARHLLGLSTDVTQETLRRELHDETISIACIGPAGERLVRFACIAHERRTASRCGTGAIMGSKNLKAIAVRGTGEVQVKNVEKLKELAANNYKNVRENMKEQSRYGTSGLEIKSYFGAVPTRNFQSGVFEYAEKLSGPFIRENVVAKMNSCPSCPVGCTKIVTIKGEAGIVTTEGPEYETVAMLGPNCGVSSINTISLANKYCDDFGLDTISTGNVIGFVMECFEKGLLTEKETGGFTIRFGDGEAMIELIKKIAFREQFGNLLAEGVRRTAEKIGKGSERFAMHVKGLEMAGYNPRSFYGVALNYATSSCGAHENRGGTYTDEIRIPLEIRFKPLGKGQLVKHGQDSRAIYDSGILCSITRRVTSLQQVSDMLEAVTGVKTSLVELESIGERINTLERAFNILAGISQKDDTLPERCLREPVREGPAKGLTLDQDKLRTMLDDYYELRGWTEEGIPRKDRLCKLGLEDVAERLENYLLNV